MNGEQGWHIFWVAERRGAHAETSPEQDSLNRCFKPCPAEHRNSAPSHAGGTALWRQGSSATAGTDCTEIADTCTRRAGPKRIRDRAPMSRQIGSPFVLIAS